MNFLDSMAKCDIADPQFLLFNDIPSLVYISHIPIFLLAFLLGFFVLWNNRNSLENIIFFLAMFFFGLWVFLDQVYWAANRPDVIMFVWTIIVLIEPLVHVFMLNLTHLLFTGKDMSFQSKLIAVLIFAPQLLLVPTTWTLSGFDLQNCIPNEAWFAYYSYTIETIYILWIVWFSLRRLRVAGGIRTSSENTYLMLGIVLFLVSFTGGNIYGSITDDWTIGAIGLFGMILLAVFVAYSIVKYQTFSVKLISTQVLVAALVIMSGSQIFLAKTLENQILTGATFILMLIFGVFLVRAVHLEILRKEELQTLANQLSTANVELKRLDSAKSEFISIASHQLRTPLTAIRGFLSLLLEGAYGTLQPKIAETLNKVTIANNRLMSLVENLLNISRIEAGRIQYQMELTQIESIVDELESMFALAAKEKGLSLVVHRPASPLPQLRLDSAKIREVLSNLIDNSFKYTEQGSITIAFESDERWVRVSITDTGMGIDPRDMDHLFKKFERGSRTERVNVSSTGLGLYVGRKFAEAHGGTIRALSAGRGKGATFILELPIPGEESAL